MAASETQPIAGYPWLATARPQGTPAQLASGRIDVRDVNPALLRALNLIGAALHKTITIFSGYRTPAYSSQVGGFANDPHTRGIAVDATIQGQPVTRYPGAARLFGVYGLISGDQPGFYQGKPDPTHVQLSTSPGTGGTTGMRIENPAHVGAFPAWADAVSRLTGLDIRVLIAWTKSEGHPGDQPGYFNWLNMKSTTARYYHVTPTGNGPADTAIFGNLKNGIVATVNAIRGIVGTSSLRGKTPREQIAAIANSPWAESHYGFNGGVNLRNTYVQMFGATSLDKPPTIGGADIAATAGTGSAADIGSVDLPGAAGAAAGAAGAAAQHIPGVVQVESIADAFRWAFGNWDRILEVAGGMVLVLAGVYMLGRHMIGSQGTDIGKLLSGQVSQRAEERGHAEGVEHGRRYEQERSDLKAQRTADRAAIRRNRSSMTRGGYTPETADIPF